MKIFFICVLCAYFVGCRPSTKVQSKSGLISGFWVSDTTQVTRWLTAGTPNMDSLPFGIIPDSPKIYYLIGGQKRFALSKGGIKPDSSSIKQLGVNLVTGYLQFDTSCKK